MLVTTWNSMARKNKTFHLRSFLKNIDKILCHRYFVNDLHLVLAKKFTGDKIRDANVVWICALKWKYERLPLAWFNKCEAAFYFYFVSSLFAKTLQRLVAQRKEKKTTTAFYNDTHVFNRLFTHSHRCVFRVFFCPFNSCAFHILLLCVAYVLCNAFTA